MLVIDISRGMLNTQKPLVMANRYGKECNSVNCMPQMRKRMIYPLKENRSDSNIGRRKA